MNRRALTVLSFLFSAGPFVAGTIRAVQTRGADLRMLWMSIAALVAALVVVTMARTRRGPAIIAIAATVVATLVAGAVGIALGARNQLGVWLVALAIGLFTAIGRWLDALARRELVSRA